MSGLDSNEGELNTMSVRTRTWLRVPAVLFLCAVTLTYVGAKSAHAHGAAPQSKNVGDSAAPAAPSPNRWGANVFLQVLDPQAFAGRNNFLTQMDFIGDACRASTPAQPDGWVRLPGDEASGNIARAQQQGIALSDATLEKLAACATQLGVVPLGAA